MLRFSIFCVTYINLGKLPKIHQWLVDYNVIEGTVNCSYLVGCIQILFKYFLVNRATLPPWNKQQALYVMYSRSCTVMTVGVICDWSWRKRLIIIKRPGAGGHSFVTHSSLLIIIREVVRWMDFLLAVNTAYSLHFCVVKRIFPVLFRQINELMALWHRDIQSQ